MSEESPKILKEKFSFRDRFYLVITVYLIFLALWYLGDFNASLLITDIISILVTVFIWYSDGILKIDIKKYRYVTYYLLVIILSLIIAPRNLFDVINILYRQGFREEIIFRLFFIGIFLIYYEGKYKNHQYFIFIVLISNIIFASLHPQFDIIAVGLAFTAIYIKGGIISSILAHTIWNIEYFGNYSIKLLAILPSIFIFPSTNDTINKIIRFVYNNARAQS